MKKLLLGLLAALLFCVPAFAHPPITVFVDRVQVNFDQQPIIQNDRTLVPMRRIFEALDAEVYWDEPSQSVTAVHGTDVILFRQGSDIHTWRNYTFENAKFTALYEDGYRYFFNVDGNKYWNQLGKNYFRGGRRNLDGFRMYHNPDKLSDLFDVADVWDEARPKPVPSIGSGM